MRPATLVRGILVGIPNEILEKFRYRLLAADKSPWIAKTGAGEPPDFGRLVNPITA